MLKKQIPFWVVAHLGKTVQLSKPWRDGIGRAFPKGSVAKLVSIQAWEDGYFATAVLEDDPQQVEENFAFGELRPA